MGIQSFNPIHLKTLGRVHTDVEAHKAIETARAAGFDNLNLDLMHGLPNQTIEEGLLDLRTGLAFAPEHLSWYQLTIEPNTVFYKLKPELPAEDDAFLLEQRGFEHLAKNNYQRYEISAFSIPHRQAEHNMNYWLFGDYYGIGAGAHGKWTSPETGVIYRTTKHRQPNDYLNPDKPYLAKLVTLTPNDCILEYMLNTTRLEQSISLMHFTERTHLPLLSLLPGLQTAQQKGLIEITNTHWRVTPHGRRFTNDLQAIFL
ncbi:MAG: hypothetical protein B7X00_01375 [Legionella sp. 21-45-4]|nr:MAG: hypothetical protein B7X00_01375 [Legionella sp. 21-45-4]